MAKSCFFFFHSSLARFPPDPFLLSFPFSSSGGEDDMAPFFSPSWLTESSRRCSLPSFSWRSPLRWMRAETWRCFPPQFGWQKSSLPFFPSPIGDFIPFLQGVGDDRAIPSLYDAKTESVFFFLSLLGVDDEPRSPFFFLGGRGSGRPFFPGT